MNTDKMSHAARRCLEQAESLLGRGDPAAACDYLERALDLAPGHPHLQTRLEAVKRRADILSANSQPAVTARLNDREHTDRISALPSHVVSAPDAFQPIVSVLRLAPWIRLWSAGTCHRFSVWRLVAKQRRDKSRREKARPVAALQGMPVQGWARGANTRRRGDGGERSVCPAALEVLQEPQVSQFQNPEADKRMGTNEWVSKGFIRLSLV